MEEIQSKISALIITFNEINHIDELIRHLNFVDEIIVIDSFSTDGTFEKLKTYQNIKIIQREFLNFADQRNFAIKQASKDWILFIDADERISPKLKKEIFDVIKSRNNEVAYKFSRKFVFKNKILRFSGLQTDKVFRLFKKGYASYFENKIVHEQLDVKGKTGVLKHDMLHYSFSSIQHYRKKTEHYASLKALELYKRGKKPNYFHFYIRPAYKFLTNYALRLGFLDGKAGYTVCRLNAYGVFFRYKELKRLHSLPKL
ncbi:glycosyltransferase family 2 protein [Litoribaculum gwangyangense]|uniref:Glycosyltransferase family 2 protein n=1 Tax=Litoribaculum gwangyangense TaxID=1130722 RepID=A0ABP9CSG7_9FLAO